MHTCRIVLFTSLVWFLLDVGVLFYYSDSPTSTSGNNVGDGRHGPVPDDLVGFPGVQAGGIHPAKREILDDPPSNALHHFNPAIVEPKHEEEVTFVLT